MDASFIAAPTSSSRASSCGTPPNGFGITERCRKYLAPLIQGEDYPPYKNGMPKYVTLKNVAVKKKLSTAFKLK